MPGSLQIDRHIGHSHFHLVVGERSPPVQSSTFEAQGALRYSNHKR
jgi:hypothetical protein